MRSSSLWPQSITPRGLHCKKPPIRRSERTVYPNLVSYLVLLHEWRLWKQMATNIIYYTPLQLSRMNEIMLNFETAQELWCATRQSNINKELPEMIEECDTAFLLRYSDISTGCSVLFLLDKRTATERSCLAFRVIQPHCEIKSQSS